MDGTSSAQEPTDRQDTPAAGAEAPPADGLPMVAAGTRSGSPPPPVAPGPAGDPSTGLTGCVPLGFTAIASALLGAVLALAVLAYVNDGQLEFAASGGAEVASATPVVAGPTPDLGVALTPAAAARATAGALEARVSDLETRVGDLETQSAALARRVDDLLTLASVAFPGGPRRVGTVTAATGTPRAVATVRATRAPTGSRSLALPTRRTPTQARTATATPRPTSTATVTPGTPRTPRPTATLRIR